MDSTLLVFGNHPRRRSAIALFAVSLVGVALHASRAGAQQACGDTLCVRGTTCATYVRECPPCSEEDSSCVICEPQTIFYCTDAECESDGDCASHMACVERPQEECEGEYPSCVDGESDDACSARVREWKAESCRTVTPRLCTPHWRLPCQADADCGAEFSCDRGACTLIDAACSVDADCPVTWICGTINVGQCLPVPGGGIDECVYNQPPLHECIEPMLFVREESADGDGTASAERGDAEPLAVPVDGASATASSPATSSPAATAEADGCSLGAAPSDVSGAGLAGLLALALLRVRRAAPRRSHASR